MKYRQSFRNTRKISFLFLFVLSLCIVTPGGPVAVTAQQPTLEQLEAQYQKNYDAILAVFANGPAKRVYPVDVRLRVREWQGELSDSFTQATNTVDEILKLNPASAEMWRERRETLAVYGRPAGTPGPRTVFGASEVKPPAKLLTTPEASATNEAGQAGTAGEVRLRMVLGADGTVKHIFPMKSLANGLTESAIAAAKQITFKPAVKNGQPVSQFLTLSYEFKKGKDKSRRPYVPVPEFYF